MLLKLVLNFNGALNFLGSAPYSWKLKIQNAVLREMRALHFHDIFFETCVYSKRFCKHTCAINCNEQ